MNYLEIATKKLNEEKANIKSQAGNLIANPVKDMLLSFCAQEDEFAQAIAESEKTFDDCIETGVLRDVHNSISDLDAYKRAVKYYFSTADVECQMKINLTANCGWEETESKPPMILNLSDFF